MLPFVPPVLQDSVVVCLLLWFSSLKHANGVQLATAQPQRGCPEAPRQAVRMF